MKNEGVPFISALTLLVSARVSVLNPFLPKPLLRAQMELEARVGIERELSFKLARASLPQVPNRHSDPRVFQV